MTRFLQLPSATLRPGYSLRVAHGDEAPSFFVVQAKALIEYTPPTNAPSTPAAMDGRFQTATLQPTPLRVLDRSIGAFVYEPAARATSTSIRPIDTSSIEDFVRERDHRQGPQALCRSDLNEALRLLCLDLSSDAWHSEIKNMCERLASHRNMLSPDLAMSERSSLLELNLLAEDQARQTDRALRDISSILSPEQRVSLHFDKTRSVIAELLTNLEKLGLALREPREQDQDCNRVS